MHTFIKGLGYSRCVLSLGQEAGDELTWVQRCGSGEDVILGHCDGSVARYNVDLFRPMGRGARGLMATRLREDNQILGMSTLQQACITLVPKEQLGGLHALG